jgi:transcription termination factor NusB
MELITTVFLSSIQGNLAEHRDAVYDAINKLDGYHCIRMEDFGARDTASLDLCIEKVKKCDCLVALIGPFYGSCPGGDERSYSEIEYDTAVESGITRFVFVCPKDFSVPSDMRESEKNRRKQQAFRARLEKERQRATFNSPSQAAQLVVIALFNWQSGRSAKLPEWVNQAVQLKEPDKPEETIPPPDSSSDVATQQRNETLKSIAAACISGDIDFREKDAENVSSVTIARLMLLSKTLFGRRCAAECLTTHEMNIFYRYKDQLWPEGWEAQLIRRSLLKDEFDVVPGWYWFKSDGPQDIEIYLWFTAMND